MTANELSVLFFLQLAAVLVACRVVSTMAIRVGQPPVVGEMIAGVVLGTSVLGYFWRRVQHTLFPPDPVRSSSQTRSLAWRCTCSRWGWSSGWIWCALGSAVRWRFPEHPDMLRPRAAKRGGSFLKSEGGSILESGEGDLLGVRAQSMLPALSARYRTLAPM